MIQHIHHHHTLGCVHFDITSTYTPSDVDLRCFPSLTWPAEFRRWVREGATRREGALKIVLALVGLLFLAGVHPIVDSLLHADHSTYTDDMMLRLSLYVALGVFMLMAVWLCDLPRRDADHCGRWNKDQWGNVYDSGRTRVRNISSLWRFPYARCRDG